MDFHVLGHQGSGMFVCLLLLFWSQSTNEIARKALVFSGLLYLINGDNDTCSIWGLVTANEILCHL